MITTTTTRKKERKKRKKQRKQKERKQERKKKERRKKERKKERNLDSIGIAVLHVTDRDLQIASVAHVVLLALVGSEKNQKEEKQG